MMAPFFKYGLFGDDVSLVVAFITGIGFGFFLERGGFNSAKKLAAQFYFTDLTVFKVMFTAIITAMVGLYYLSVIGFLDLSLVYLTPTFLLPQVVGGLLLGFGFVIGGYCPGTSCVAVSTGRIDAMVYLGGTMFGILVFGEVFPLVSNFYVSTPMGQITLPQITGLPYGLLVFLVVLMALGGFVGAEWVERKMASKKAGAAL
ncbi:MAG: YeeE/YedE thiosulfate transporter family protein [Ignavibacteriales bacterium]|nr:YeeE/YedE thiosulfate transporter family protein [Ignavibacteriales bacterium]